MNENNCFILFLSMKLIENYSHISHEFKPTTLVFYINTKKNYCKINETISHKIFIENIYLPPNRYNDICRIVHKLFEVLPMIFKSKFSFVY